MFGLGMPEILLILAIALIVIGPKRLPDLAKTLGRAMGEFKRATTDFKNSIDLDTGIDDIKPSSNNIRRNIKEANEPGKEDGGTDSEGESSSADESAAGNADYEDEAYKDGQSEDAGAKEKPGAAEDATHGESPDEEKKRTADRRDSADESNETGTRAD